MDKEISEALARDRTIDITTIGRKTGEPRRKEIWYHRWDDRYFITGSPGRRDWYANLRANPEFIFHLKESAQADLPARARPIEEQAERRETLSGLLQKLNRSTDLEEWMARSPLVEVTFPTRS